MRGSGAWRGVRVWCMQEHYQCHEWWHRLVCGASMHSVAAVPALGPSTGQDSAGAQEHCIPIVVIPCCARGAVCLEMTMAQGVKQHQVCNTCCSEDPFSGVVVRTALEALSPGAASPRTRPRPQRRIPGPFPAPPQWHMISIGVEKACRSRRRREEKGIPCLRASRLGCRERRRGCSAAQRLKAEQDCRKELCQACLQQRAWATLGQLRTGGCSTLCIDSVRGP